MRGLAGRPGPLLPQLKIRFDKTAVQKDDGTAVFFVRQKRTGCTLSQPKFSPDMKMLSRATSRMTAQTTAIFEES